MMGAALQAWSDSMARTQQEPTSDPTSFVVLSDHETRMERVFNAPVAVVFKAYTDAKQIPHWWGPRDQATRVETMEVRQGGRWRFVHTATDGTHNAFRGIYREIAPNKRIVNTFEFEPQAGHISEDTATFADQNGKTLVTVTTRFANQADRDGMLDSGMEQGSRESWDRLAELVEVARTTLPGKARKAGEEEEE